MADNVVRHPPVRRELVTLFVYWLTVVCLASLALLGPATVRAAEVLDLVPPTRLVVGEVLEFTSFGGPQDRDVKLYVDVAAGECMLPLPEYVTDGAQLSLVVPEQVAVSDTIGAFAALYWDTLGFPAGTYYVQAIVLDQNKTYISQVVEIELVPVEEEWRAFDLAGERWCGVLNDDTVRCGNTPNVSLLPVVKPVGEVHAIAVAARGACVVAGDDLHLECWQSGQQSIVSRMPVGGGWASVDAYSDHFCATNIAGHGVCWGNTSNNRTAVPGGEEWYVIMAGGAHSCGVTIDWRVRCWGYNGQSQLPATIDPRWLNVAVGDWHTILSDGQYLKAHGANNRGEVWGRREQDFGLHYQVVTSNSIGCVLANADSSARCWGDLRSVVLDDGTPLADGFVDISFQTLATGSGDMMCGIDTFGQLRCFGTGSEWGRWGDALPTPFQN